MMYKGIKKGIIRSLKENLDMIAKLRARAAEAKSFELPEMEAGALEGIAPYASDVIRLRGELYALEKALTND